MNSKLLKYIFILIYGLIISSGPICLAYVTAQRDIGHSIMALMVPFALIIYAIIYIVTNVLYPRFIPKGRYIAFAISAWLSAYTTDLVVFYTEYLFRAWKHIPQTVENPLSPWIFLYSVFSSLVLMMTIAGFLLWKFYEDNRRQCIEEQIYKKDIQQKQHIFREKINMAEIKNRLRNISAIINKNQKQANAEIRSLSEFLRRRLYENQEMIPHTPPCTHASPHNAWIPSWHMNFIVDKRFRMLRHLSLIGLLGCMSAGLLFDRPDKPMLDPYHLWYAVFFFISVSLLVYLNLYIVFPFFLRKGRQRIYLYLLVGIVAIIFIAMNIFTISYGHLTNEYGVRMPAILIPFGVAGNILSYLLLLAGTVSLRMLKKNMLGKWRLNRLEMERAMTELEILKQQISPHTLFNLLNNISILSEDDPAQAARMLKSFEDFLEYILTESDRPLTTIGDEISFIRNYLMLEESTGRSLRYTISCPAELANYKLPPLLLIPFVENAVKHSINVRSHRIIRIEFHHSGNYLIFACSNPFLPHPDSKTANSRRSAGLGLSNTHRRLNLLYEHTFSYNVQKTNSQYSIQLKLPYEMHCD